jgi:hypothetical protein
LPPSQDRRRIRAQREHIKNIATHPALTGEGSYFVYRAGIQVAAALDIR